MVGTTNFKFKHLILDENIPKIMIDALHVETLTKDAIALLVSLIEVESFSKTENKSADKIEEYFREQAMPFSRLKNNIYSRNKYFNPDLPTILLNSHHDTVKPNISWTYDPFKASFTEDGKIVGLGSNDAGASLVSLIATFAFFYHRSDLKFNLILAATAEEEISGKEGIELLLSKLPPIDFAIVGEPTEMNLAISEKGLLVLDCVSKGISGHAAREEGENAIYKAIKDIEWFRTFQFPKISETLGPIKMSVTLINAGTQHNVVPDECKFTVDVRATDAYTLEETIEIIKQNINSECTPRSVRLSPSSIDSDHPVVKAGLALGYATYGSPTLSDQALMPFPSLKCGPGKSERSHTADEFIYISEIESGIVTYIKMLQMVLI